MSESKAYNLKFEEPPERERKGRGKQEYTDTLEAFLSSGRDYAKVEVPKTEKMSNVFLGLKHAIARKGKSDVIKIIMRKKTLYLVTKAYSDKRGWIWKVKRKKK